MSRFLDQTILISVTFLFVIAGYSQTNNATVDWNKLLMDSNFTTINSIRRINKNILSKFSSWKKMSKPGGRFNATDTGGGRRLRLYFIAKTGNHWIISYEHGGYGYHTHCFLITIDTQDKLDIQESNIKFESLDHLKSRIRVEDNLFSQWVGYHY